MEHSTQSFSPVEQLTGKTFYKPLFITIFIERHCAMSVFCLFYQIGMILTTFERIPLYSNVLRNFFLPFAHVPLMATSLQTKIFVRKESKHKGLCRT